MTSRTVALVLAAVSVVACGEEAERPESRPAPAPAPVLDPPPSRPPVIEAASLRLREFAGFSRDGQRFAYGSASATGGADHYTVWVTTAGSSSAEVLEMIFDAEGEAAARRALDEGGFTDARTPAPEGLTIEPHLTDSPPTVVVRREGRERTAVIEEAPFPATDTASLWGVSSDGRYAVIDVHGPEVDGLLTRAGAGTVRFFRVVELP